MPGKTIKIYLKGTETKVKDAVMDDNGNLVKLETDKIIAIPSKKNSKTALKSKSTGKMFLKFSDQYINWKKKMHGFFQEQYFKLYNEGVRLPIVRCNIKVLFYFADNKVTDAQNKWETLADTLVEHEILMDDSIRVISETCLKAYVCRDRPRTEIYITILTPEDPDYDYDITDHAKMKKRKSDRLKSKYQISKLKKSGSTRK